jgi:autotransporter-associated beta strand protein
MKKSFRSKRPAQRRPLKSLTVNSSRFPHETLEDRMMLAARIWDGGGADNLWATAGNWAGDVAPQAGDDLVFVDAAAQKNNVNNFAAGTLFNTIQFTGSGYAVSGADINLFGGVTSSQTTGANSLTTKLVLQNAVNLVSANANTSLTLGAIDTNGLLGQTNTLGTSALTTDGAGTLQIGGEISGQGGLNKLGSGTLILSGANSYAGLTDVRQGALNIRATTALGAISAGTNVFPGAELELQGGISVAEPLALREGGISIDSSQAMGALRSTGGANTWTGAIDLASNAAIGVDAGSVLDINAPIGSAQTGVNNRQLTKAGDGVLRLSGNVANTFTGTTTVLRGTLELNKTGVLAMQSSLVIGDNFSGDTAATVRLLQDNQLPRLDLNNTTLNTLTVNSSGLLDLNGHSDEIGHLTLFEGVTYSADVTTGAGTLIMDGNLTLTAYQGTNGQSPAATISGKLDLGTFFSGGTGITTRTFLVNESSSPNIATDLIISAVISGTSDISITKTGAVTLRLTGANTYAGPTILNGAGGLVEVGNNAAFGTGLVSNVSTFLSAFGGARTVANRISVDGNFVAYGSNNLTFTGQTTMTASRNFYVMDPNQTTTFTAGIDDGVLGNLNLVKIGRGTLALTGANTYSGSTTVNNDGGTLLLKDNGTLLNTSAISVNAGGVFTLDNTGSANLTDRINDTTAITLANGRLRFIGANNAASSENLGAIALTNQTSSEIESDVTGATGTAVVTMNALTLDPNNAPSIRFIGVGADLSATGRNRISAVNPPVAPSNGILPFAAVLGSGGVDFATFAISAEGISFFALPSNGFVTDINQAGTTSNVKITTPGTYTLTVDRTINSLTLGPGVILDGAGFQLTIAQNGLIFQGGGASTIQGLTLNLNARSVIFATAGSVDTISSTIVGAATSIVKAGLGTLILSGDNQFAGSMNVNEGILNIQRSTALGAIGGVTNVAQGATLQLQQTTFGPINVSNETLNLRGVGYNPTNNYADAPGALVNVSGVNSWAGGVVVTGDAGDLTSLLGGFSAVNNAEVFISSLAGNLVLTGALSGDSVELVKLGAGSLEYGGVLANTSANSSTRVVAGTVLNKQTGVNAILGNTVYVGDDSSAPNSATLRIVGNEQIRDDRGVQINASGRLEIADGVSETLVFLNLVVGPNSAASVSLGAGSTITLNSAAPITLLSNGVGNPTGATISGGTLALGIPGLAG